MTALLTLAARSAWNRRFVLSLVLLSIALSTFLLLGIERLRTDVRATFSSAVSGTDLVVGARTAPVQLLLYSVFHIGNASNNIRWASAQAIAQHRAVAWALPLALGDSHRGFAVLGTSAEYFQRFKYGDKQALTFKSGGQFELLFDAVIGNEVAQRLGYGLGAKIVLSHGDGALADNDHDDQPFKVVGILAPTGTPVDRTVHIGLNAIEAIHVDWASGMHVRSRPDAAAAPPDLTPRSVTALLVGLKSRAAVFAVQRDVAAFRDEPLLAILPAVALDELWSVMALGERGLQLVSALVALVSLAALMAVILAGLNERRRELAILRAVGAGPRQMLALLALEGGLVTAAGVLLGALACWAATLLLGGWVQGRWGIVLHASAPSAAEWALIGALLAAGWLASLVPGWRAYRLSLIDGLSPRV